MKRWICILIACVAILGGVSETYAQDIIDYPNEYAELFDEMSQEDWDYLAKAAMCEAGYSNLECCSGTICVILNRVLDTKTFGRVNTVKDVVLQKGQFSTRKYFDKAKPNQLVYDSIAYVQNHGAQVIRNKLAEQGWDFLATDYVYFSVGKQTGYAQDFLFIGTPERGQHHHIGRAKE